MAALVAQKSGQTKDNVGIPCGVRGDLPWLEGVLFSSSLPSQYSKSLSVPGTTARGMADQLVDDVVEV